MLDQAAQQLAEPGIRVFTKLSTTAAVAVSSVKSVAMTDSVSPRSAGGTDLR